MAFYGMAPLILILVIYWKYKSRILLELLFLFSSMTAAMVLYSFLHFTGMHNIMSAATTRWLFPVGGIFVYFLRIFYQLTIVRIFPFIDNSLRWKRLDRLLVLLLILLQTGGLIHWIRTFPLPRGDVYGFTIFSFLSRMLIILYAIVKLIRLDTRGKGDLLKLSRRILLPVLCLNWIVWFIEDFLSLLQGSRLHSFGDAFSSFSLSTVGIYLLNRFLSAYPASKEIDKETFVRDTGLSAREKEVFEMLIMGERYKTISENLHISVDTVKSHASSIYRKTGVPGKHALHKLFNL